VKNQAVYRKRLKNKGKLQEIYFAKDEFKYELSMEIDEMEYLVEPELK
jgi:hypothetical protein